MAVDGHVRRVVLGSDARRGGGALDGGGDAGRDSALEHLAAPARRVQRGGVAVDSLVAQELRGDAPRGGAERVVQRDHGNEGVE